MAKFIEEFYYGNLYPQARSTKQNKTVEKFMDVWYACAIIGTKKLLSRIFDKEWFKQNI